MLESRSVNEWESWLQRREVKDVHWDDAEELRFLSSVLLICLPKRWMHEMQVAGTSDVSNQPGS